MVMEESTCLSYYAEIPVAIIGNSVSNFRYFYLTLNITTASRSPSIYIQGTRMSSPH